MVKAMSLQSICLYVAVLKSPKNRNSLNFDFILSDGIQNYRFKGDYTHAHTHVQHCLSEFSLTVLSSFFQLPSIEVVVKSPPIGRDQKWPPILVLVICPTRELASQAAAEANILLKYHPSIGVQVVIGGTRLALEQKRMQANPCQVSDFIICQRTVIYGLL